MGVENGMYEGVALAKNAQDPKKKAHFTYSAEVPEDNQGSSSKHGQRQWHKAWTEQRKEREVLQEQWQASPDRSSTKRGSSRKTQAHKLEQGSKIYSPRPAFGKDSGILAISRNGKTSQSCRSASDHGKIQGTVLQVPQSDGPWHWILFRPEKHLIQDCIDKSILIEDEEEGKMDILSAPFPKHSASTISEHSFLPQSHIHPCSSEDISLQHQVMVLHQDQPASQRGNILSFLNIRNMSVRSGKTQVFPKRFLKKEACAEEAETSEAAEERAKSLQKPITALSNISIFELTHDSPKHQEKLDDLLRKIKVKPGTTPEDMAQIVNQAMTNAPITFSDEDLPKPHSFHNNALYIVVRTRGMTVPHVLVDGGSSLNICPEMTAKALGLKEEEYVPDPITIYGFDNHGQTAKGKIFLEIFINYSVHTVLFHVVNVPPLTIFCWDEHGSITPMPFHQPSINA